MNYNPFNELHNKYEQWFKTNQNIYQSELNAIKAINNKWENSIEIGVGTGLFASKLGITTGIDPSPNMLQLANKRGITVVQGVAENIPFKNSIFNTALMVTSICFIKNPQKALKEAHRIIKKNGALIIAFIDKQSPLGKLYNQNKIHDEFYKFATFYTVNDISNLLTNAGFEIEQTVQTVQTNDNSKIEDYEIGHGKGSFIVIKGIKK